ncbi:GYD domain-containing protein [Halostella litorea]|uniref:GYD domain-containing protein n=1 Tax=Halostella litorea TaxID=2528831 RepID=UPI001093347A|nr:GYD domain-containing protein [Halostella litorea]
MPQFAVLVTVDDAEFQNVQDLATLWGEIRTEIGERDVELAESYAALGEYDFLVTIDAADRDAAYRTALAIGRHGLRTETIPIEETEKFADLVDDI